MLLLSSSMMELDARIIILYGIFICILLLVICFTETKSKSTKYSIDQNICPSHNASLISKLFLSWVGNYIWKYHKKPLKSNLWDLDDEDRTSYLKDEFEKHINKIKYEGAKESVSITGSHTYNLPSEKISILKLLFKANKFPFLNGIFWRGLDVWMGLAYPIIFSMLTSYLSDPEQMYKIYVCICGFAVSPIINTLATNKFFCNLTKLRMHIRSTLVSMIYEKILKTTDIARRSYTTGELVNLMTTDVEKIADMVECIHYLSSLPVYFALLFYFLWQTLNYCVVFGILTLMIAIPTNLTMIATIVKQTRTETVHRNERGRFTQDLLAGIKILKMYAWESNFEKKALSLRKEEAKQLKKSGNLTDWLNFLFNCIPPLISFVCFVTYFYFTNMVITVAQVFVTISFLNTVRTPLNYTSFYLPNLTQGIISTKRINEFLNLPEIDKSVVSRENNDCSLWMKNATFVWTTNDVPVLRNLNVKIDKGTFVTVVGPIGAGKSSLISAFLGELQKTSGYVNVNGKVAYVPQQAWMLNATFKDNITMGAPVDESLYKAALKACTLDIDLRNFPAGDLTEIGEKGVNVSGGQKQRINIARAICCNADIYFFDDSLSAVDVQVAKHILQHVLGPDGILNQKTRILVTHNTSFLSQSDLIIALKDGCIAESGTFQNLIEKGGYFSSLLAKYGNEVKGDDCNFAVEQCVDNVEEAIRKMRQERPDPSNKSTLIEEEFVETSAVKNETWKFFTSMIGISIFVLVLICIIMSQTFSVCSRIWLIAYVSDNDDTHSPLFYLLIYLIFGLADAVSSKIASKILLHGVINASSKIYNKLLSCVLNWPLWLLDCTPVGRIMNRTTSDVTTIDSITCKRLKSLMELSNRLLVIFLVSCYIVPISSVIIVIVFIVFYVIQRTYRPFIYQLKRVNSNNMSPLSSHFTETINGLVSIRANRFQEKFISMLNEKNDLSVSARYAITASYRWCTTRIEILFGLAVFVITCFIIRERSTLGIEKLCFATSYIMQWTKEFQSYLFFMLDLESSIISVERIKQYIDFPQEKNAERTCQVAAEWPTKGVIQFHKYKLRYRQNDDLVLKGLTFRVENGEKIGIIGRTGAGKSSLIFALMRLVEPADGTIFIDDVDIREVELRILRSRLTIIPQDAVLFLGTLRFNLDPTEQCNDEALWNTLEKSHLKTFVQQLPDGLQTAIEESGGNLSGGQKQLLCLARALLRKTQILILDEATASVDVETDELIQKTIRREFSQCTVLTVAHRLNTVQDYDRILVMDNGNAIEFDTPEDLLKSKQSVFYSIMLKSGLITE